MWKATRRERPRLRRSNRRRRGCRLTTSDGPLGLLRALGLASIVSCAAIIAESSARGESVAFAPIVEVLKAPAMISGIMLPKGTTVAVASGELPQLVRAEIPIAVTIKSIRFPAKSRIELDASGHLLEAQLGAPAKIQSILCAATMVRFHPSGRLASAQLEEASTIGGTRFPAR